MKTDFLQRRPLPEARALFVAGVAPVGSEEVAVDDAAGRVAAASVVARHPSPHYRASAMDGIAVRSADTRAAGDAPLVLCALAPSQPPDGAGPCCTPVDTGSLLPGWADAVVRIEDTVAEDGGFRIRAAVPPGRDVRRAGEDIDEGTVLVPAGSRIRPWDVGAMLATGTTRVAVRRRPRVGIVATGSEVVEPGAGAGPGQVIESSSRVVAALVERWGGSAHRLGIVADDEAGLRGAFADAASRFDAVVAIAGSSAGRKDFTIATLASLGELVVHGVDIAPGRPVALARLRSGGGEGAPTPAIAVPGYPVATIVTCEQLLRPLVAALLGTAEELPARLRAKVVRKVPSRLGVEEFRRACLVTQQDGTRVVALLPAAAASISSVSGAHAWLRIGPAVEGIDAGTEVDVELLVSQEEVDAAFVLAGRPSADSRVLEEALRRRDPRARVLHLGLGPHDAAGAVERGEAHGLLATDVAAPLVARRVAGVGCEVAVQPGSAGDRRLVAAS